MSLDADYVVERRRLKRRLTFWRVLGVVALVAAVVVAAGRFDGYWERELKLWDIAAGYLIALEAGALVDGVRAGQDPLESGALLCANNAIFDGFAKIIREV